LGLGEKTRRKVTRKGKGNKFDEMLTEEQAAGKVGLLELSDMGHLQHYIIGKQTPPEQDFNTEYTAPPLPHYAAVGHRAEIEVSFW
jgi:hypothetical protein